MSIKSLLTSACLCVIFCSITSLPPSRVDQSHVLLASCPGCVLALVVSSALRAITDEVVQLATPDLCKLLVLLGFLVGEFQHLLDVLRFVGLLLVLPIDFLNFGLSPRFDCIHRYVLLSIFNNLLVAGNLYISPLRLFLKTYQLVLAAL